MKSAKKRVLIIGIDGFTWRLGRAMISEGVMPTLASMVAQGCHGNLDSVMPFETGPAWSAFQTGCRPGKTGIFAFHSFDRNAGKVKLNSFEDIAVPSLWELADRAGKTVVSINLPVSSPPPEVRGVIIPGLLCPRLSRSTVHPAEAYDKYIAGRKDYTIVNNTHCDTVRQFVRQSMTAELLRRDVALEIMNDVDWDIFCFQIQSSDLMQHRLWWALDPSASGFSASDNAEALEFYRCCDRIIDDLARAAGPETLIMVVSDHGFCKSVGGVHINVWLRQKGYLKLPPEKPQGGWDIIKNRVPPLKLMASFYGGCRRRAGQLVADVSAALSGGKKKQIPFSEVELRHLRQLIDFETTEAFCLGGMGGMLYITARGERKAQLCNQIAEELLRDLGPGSSRPAILRVLAAKEIYGQCRGITTMPDLVLELKEGFTSIINPLGREEVDLHDPKANQPGTHDRQGVIVISGPPVKPGQKINAEIVDITPTVLAYLGIAVGGNMDGKVLSEVFAEPPVVRYEDISTERRRAEYTDDEQAAVERHLTDLGYM